MPQRLFVDIETTQLSDEDRELLLHPEVAGLILFARNYQSRSQITDLVAEVRDISPGLLVGVDQEGGRVQRFSGSGFTRLPALQHLGDLYKKNPDMAGEASFLHGWLMAAEILSAGLDLSFAPVLDLDHNHCRAIGDRSFSENPMVSIEMARSYLRGMNEAGMAATAKHFPGHGSVEVDSHVGLPEDSRPLEYIEGHDLLPFKKLVLSYQAVMPGHLLFPKVDSKPVGFSSIWLQRILREKLGFTGVIFSDDLSMAGAAASGSYAERAELALNAGCDLLLACNNRQGTCEILKFLDQGGHGSGAECVRLMKAKEYMDYEQVLIEPNYSRAQQIMKTLQEKIDA
ncbi:MAG: beta-N-acetylhexosaminidase [Pseudomonadales bacterium]